MKYLEQKLFNFLIKNDNFYIKEYYSKFYDKLNYIAIKELGYGSYCVLVTSEEHEDINVQEAIEYLKTLGKNFALNIVVLSNGEYLGSKQENINKLVINKKNNNIVLCDTSCEPLKNIITNINKSSEFKLNKFSKNKKITLILIAINVVIFLLTAFISGNILSININVLINFGAKYNPLIYQGEIWRLITCAFLHGGITHLLFNMYALYILGPQVEKIFGIKKYLSIYFISAITSSLLGVVLNENSVSVGASGAIFGLLGAILAFSIKERHKVEKEYILNLIGIIILNLIIGFNISNIDNLGHIGGFIGGLIMGRILIIKKI
ncbi:MULTISPECIES: rhomboid family intramembrane serine protease [unclassified Clostridium]|uniref:rhomboid family intramembrane serine protease n=1 Tax=unclassified Clostridium TaxID=2614128 RepID=UPI0013FB79EA|nr:MULTISPECIES: rhomboid family intramembrane serine protease [unclassified Clostridium]NFR88083.1 rhomboid family intramembrane serine protease [Clostridium botulinum]NFR89443.1 rhomboid family intramembrane serine protease [Clostridium botulinum]NFT98929.1 rhomboid family intramembrane serine protease [Clostridium botulinum]